VIGRASRNVFWFACKSLRRARRKAITCRALVHRPLISVVTVGEIRALAGQFNWGAAKREFLTKVLQTLVILDINGQSVFNAYVEVDHACRKTRGGARSLSKNDL